MERKWWTLVAVVGGIFMLLLDVTIVNVALPDIEQRARRLAGGPAVGDRRLRADAGRAAADRRLAGRPLRAPAAVRDRDRRLHARLAAVRPGAERDLPQPLAGLPGHRRGDHVRHRPRAALRRLPRQGPRRRLRRLRRHDRRRRRRRAGAGRSADLRPVLALDLPGQHPGRDRDADRHAARGPRVARRPRTPDRLPRPGHLQPRPGRARLRADPLERGRLGLDHGGGLAGRGRGPADRVRGRRGAAARADVRPHAVQEADLRRRADRRLRHLGLAVQRRSRTW